MIGYEYHQYFSVPPVQGFPECNGRHLALHSLPPNFGNDKQNKITVEITPKDGGSYDEGEKLILLTCTVKPLVEVSFQWYYMLNPIDGATQKVFHIDDASLKDQGYYCCIVKTKTHNPLQLRSPWCFVSIGPKGHEYFATDKVALLIGNEHYKNYKSLPAAPRDIEVLTNILQNELGFKTLSFVNLTLVEMHKALRLLRDLSKAGCYCLFYFGGHGYEHGGKCFMVPTDAPDNFGNEDCVNIHTELEDIQRRCKPSLLLILLDICRKRNVQESSRDSHPTSFLPNVVIAYATMETREAYEKTGEKHGLFVNSLQKHLAKRERVDHMLSAVQNDVGQSHIQVPEVKTTLVEERCLTDRIKPATDLIPEWCRWLCLHGKIVNVPLVTEVGQKAVVELRYWSALTNKIIISVRVREHREDIMNADAYIDARSLPIEDGILLYRDNGEPWDPRVCRPYLRSVGISNLHKIKTTTFRVRVAFVYGPNSKKYRQIYEEELSPYSINIWQSLLQEVRSVHPSLDH